MKKSLIKKLKMIKKVGWQAKNTIETAKTL